MLTVFRIVCSAGNPDLLFLGVGISGYDTAPGLLGAAAGRDGCLSREGVCGRLFLAGFDGGTGGSADVGGSAAGRESTGNDISAQQKLDASGSLYSAATSRGNNALRPHARSQWTQSSEDPWRCVS